MAVTVAVAAVAAAEKNRANPLTERRLLGTVEKVTIAVLKIVNDSAKSMHAPVLSALTDWS